MVGSKVAAGLHDSAAGTAVAFRGPDVHNSGTGQAAVLPCSLLLPLRAWLITARSGITLTP